MSDFDLEEYKKQRQKEQRIGKLFFWVIAIPVGVTICLLSREYIHITGCAMGAVIYGIYKSMFK